MERTTSWRPEERKVLKEPERPRYNKNCRLCKKLEKEKHDLSTNHDFIENRNIEVADGRKQ